MTDKILLLGIGNDILKDDGIGPWLAREMGNRCRHPRIVNDILYLGGMEVLEYIQGYHAVYLFDAIKTEQGEVGDIFFLKPEDFKETLHLSSLHDLGFLDALELGRRLDFEIPEFIRIAAVEIKEDTEFGSEFSPELSQKIDEICSFVENDLRIWLNNFSVSF